MCKRYMEIKNKNFNFKGEITLYLKIVLFISFIKMTESLINQV